MDNNQISSKFVTTFEGEFCWRTGRHYTVVLCTSCKDCTVQKGRLVFHCRLEILCSLPTFLAMSS